MVNEENNELTEEQKKEKKREYALESLKNEYITNLASVGLSKPEEGRTSQYGMIFSGLYKSTIKKDTNKQVHDALFRKPLEEGESINKESLINKASEIITYSVMRVKPGDILELIGSEETPKQEYGDKVIGELSDEDKKQILNLYVNYMINKKAGDRLAEGRKSLVGGLEGILSKEKAPEQPAQASRIVYTEREPEQYAQAG